MAYGLLKRILAHAKEQGWLKEGDVILDPFGGIGSTGILGAYEGYQCVCCELEQKFIQLAEGYDCPGLTKKKWLRWFNRFSRNPDICPSCHGQAQGWYEKHSGIIPSKEPHRFVGNFELHDNAWQKFGNPRPVIIQGDSRQLCQIVEKADCIISSPPYTENLAGGGEAMQPRPGDIRKSRRTMTHDENYGQTPGQLGSMKPGKVDAIISSPPYAESGGTPSLGSINKDDWGKEGKDICGRRGLTAHYGDTEGNLGNLKSGDVDCVISSPPYEGSLDRSKNAGRVENVKRRKKIMEYGGLASYSNNEKQLGNYKGDTFWSAAKIIIEQCHKILKPGGVAIFVVKSFVRNKKIVDFPGDWQRLCESVGFKTVCIHHAMLVKETEHKTLFGDTEVKRKERKSFFRRLAESKGSPRIDFENVLCMSKDA